jgi:hypothetical protein
MSTWEPLRSVHSDRAANLAGAVQRVDAVAISADFARVLVFWLGNYAKLARQTKGCAPDGLEDAQYVLAEACAPGGDSRLREDSTPGHAEILALGHDAVVDAETAAQMLGLKADTVRLMCRKGQLEAQKRAGRWFPTIAAVQQRSSQRSWYDED